MFNYQIGVITEWMKLLINFLNDLELNLMRNVEFFSRRALAGSELGDVKACHIRDLET